MARFVCLLAALLAASTSRAGEPTADLAALWGQMAKVGQVSAEFEQTQQRAILKQPLVSKGVLAFQRPDRLRWEVRSPSPSVFILQGTRIAMAYPALGITQEHDLAEQPEAARIVAAMLVWLAADLEAVERDYVVSFDGHIATLTPKTASLRAMLAWVELTIAGTPPHVQRILLAEPSGDQVSIVLSAVKDAALPEGTFTLPAAE